MKIAKNSKFSTLISDIYGSNKLFFLIDFNQLNFGLCFDKQI